MFLSAVKSSSGGLGEVFRFRDCTDYVLRVGAAGAANTLVQLDHYHGTQLVKTVSASIPAGSGQSFVQPDTDNLTPWTYVVVQIGTATIPNPITATITGDYGSIHDTEH